MFTKIPKLTWIDANFWKYSGNGLFNWYCTLYSEQTGALSINFQFQPPLQSIVSATIGMPHPKDLLAVGNVDKSSWRRAWQSMLVMLLFPRVMFHATNLTPFKSIFSIGILFLPVSLSPFPPSGSLTPVILNPFTIELRHHNYSNLTFQFPPVSFFYFSCLALNYFFPFLNFFLLSFFFNWSSFT